MKQGENWIPGVLMYINFRAGEKDGGGGRIALLASRGWLSNRLFLEYKKNRNLAGGI